MFELNIMDSFPKFMFSPQDHEQGGVVYDGKQVYPKVLRLKDILVSDFEFRFRDRELNV